MSCLDITKSLKSWLMLRMLVLHFINNILWHVFKVCVTNEIYNKQSIQKSLLPWDAGLRHWLLWIVVIRYSSRCVVHKMDWGFARLYTFWGVFCLVICDLMNGASSYIDICKPEKKILESLQIKGSIHLCLWLRAKCRTRVHIVQWISKSTDTVQKDKYNG